MRILAKFHMKKCDFLPFEAKNQKNGLATRPGLSLRYSRIKNESKKVKNERQVTFAKAWRRRCFGRFSKNFFDFLTSKYQFLRDVPNIKVVQNKIPYISLTSEFSYDQNWRKSILGYFCGKHANLISRNQNTNSEIQSPRSKTQSGKARQQENHKVQTFESQPMVNFSRPKSRI